MPFRRTKALPPISVLTSFVGLAAVSVLVCENLKPSHIELYDALISLHNLIPCLGPNHYSAARDTSVLIRKILGWFRDITFNSDKKDQVLSNASREECMLIFNVSDKVRREHGESTSEHVHDGASSPSSTYYCKGSSQPVGRTARQNSQSSVGSIDSGNNSQSSVGNIDRGDSSQSIESISPSESKPDAGWMSVVDDLLDCQSVVKYVPAVVDPYTVFENAFNYLDEYS